MDFYVQHGEARASARVISGRNLAVDIIERVNRFFEWIGLKEKLHRSDHKPPFVSERDVWWASLGENIGSEVNGKSDRFSRPVLVLRNWRMVSTWWRRRRRSRAKALSTCISVWRIRMSMSALIKFGRSTIAACIPSSVR